MICINLFRCKKFGKLLYNTLHSIQDDLLVLSCQKWEMEPDVDLQDTVNSLYKLFEHICQWWVPVFFWKKHNLGIFLYKHLNHLWMSGFFLSAADKTIFFQCNIEKWDICFSLRQPSKNYTLQTSTGCFKTSSMYTDHHHKTSYKTSCKGPLNKLWWYSNEEIIGQWSVSNVKQANVNIKTSTDYCIEDVAWLSMRQPPTKWQ